MADWNEIMRQYGPMVWRTSYKMLGNHVDADECYQEAFIAAFRVSQRQEIRDYGALLKRTAICRGLDILRKRRILSESLKQQGADMESLRDTSAEPASRAQDEELSGMAREAIERLSEKEAIIFCMKYLDEMTTTEISKALGMKTGSISAILHRSREKLKQYFKVSIRESGVE